MKTKKPIIPTILLAVIFLSCEIEKTENPYLESSESFKLSAEIQELKSNFNLNNIENNSYFPMLEDIDWSNSLKVEIEGREWYEFQFVISPFFEISPGRVTNINYSLLVTYDQNDHPLYFITKMVSYNGDSLTSYFDHKSRFFTGMVYFYGQHGLPTSLQYIRKGEIVSAVLDAENIVSNITPLSASCDQRAPTCTLQNGCEPPLTTPCSGSGSWEWTRTGSYDVYWYNDHNNDGNGQASEFSYKTPGGDTYEWVWVPSGSSAPATQNYQNFYLQTDPTGVGYYIPKPKPVSLDIIKLDLSLKNTKTLCVFQKLR